VSAGRQERCIACQKPAKQLHHVVYQQHLRAILADSTDRRSVVPVCLSCHARHHGRQAPIPLAALPDYSYRHALEVFGDAGRAYEYLRRRYGGSDLRLDALLPQGLEAS
jgi:hypothetical protein